MEYGSCGSPAEILLPALSSAGTGVVAALMEGSPRRL